MISQGPDIPTTYIKAIRQEIAEFRILVEATTPSTDSAVDGKWAIKKEVEDLLQRTKISKPR